MKSLFDQLSPQATQLVALAVGVDNPGASFRNNLREVPALPDDAFTIGDAVRAYLTTTLSRFSNLTCPSCDKPVDVPGKCHQCRLEDACENTTARADVTAQVWELLGHVCVDSGQLLLVDPTYIDSRWDHAGATVHHPGPDNLNILSCEEVLRGEAGGGEVAQLAVAFLAGYTNGAFPVSVRRNAAGRILQVLINFCNSNGD